MQHTRRTFVKSVAVASGAALVFPAKNSFSKNTKQRHEIACEQYTWYSYFLRENKKWMENPDDSIKAMLSSGLMGYEPSFEGPEDIAPLISKLAAAKITAKSMYVNSVLHEPLLVDENIKKVLAIAREAAKAGIKILVTNPTPIDWNGKDNKTDEQLKSQAIALTLLGKELKAIGMTLAYHNHDAEMRESAREFHHMLTGTDPEFVKLCLDAHWIYRGSGNSQVALFDIIEIYAHRIVELHIRQSHDGIWSEVFEDGDIDYSRLANVLKAKNIIPHIVLEQAVEAGTPQTMDAVGAINKSLANARTTFAGLL